MRMLPRLVVLSIVATATSCLVPEVVYREIPGTIGGTVTGLVGAGLVLTANGADDLQISRDGTFAFPTPMQRGENYVVAVKRQPSSPAQVCSVEHGSGTAGDRVVTDVEVSCMTSSFTIGGTVAGLAGAGLVLQNNGGDEIVVGSDGGFVFATPVASGAGYEVTVRGQPSQPTQTCVVAGGTGTVAGENVTSVVVTCATDAFTISGTVTGLAGSGLVLQNNGTDDLALSADGEFTFATPVASGARFEVTVQTQPTRPTQVCTVVGGTGTIVGDAVTSVVINCATNRFVIGGTISGLAGTVILQNNGGDDLTLTSNGTFAFPTSLLSGASYNVTVRTQPATLSQTCSVANRTGTVGGANVTNVAVTCTTNVFTIGGTVSGLAPGDSITLRNNGGNDLVRSANGGFTFTAPVASGQAYAVTIVANPLSPVAQTCSVGNGTGGVGGANITNVTVTCVTRTFAIGGTASGMTGGGAVLQLNGGETLQVGDGGFSFSTRVASGAPYDVSIVSAPLGRTCNLANRTGTVGASDVTNIVVACTGVAPSNGSFFYSAANTASATQNTFNVDIVIVAGQTLSIGTCIVPGASGTGDTVLRLVDASNATVALNDDVPGAAECAPLLSHFTFTATTTQTFQIRAGCFQELACNGTVAYTLSGT